MSNPRKTLLHFSYCYDETSVLVKLMTEQTTLCRVFFSQIATCKDVHNEGKKSF